MIGVSFELEIFQFSIVTIYLPQWMSLKKWLSPLACFCKGRTFFWGYSLRDEGSRQPDETLHRRHHQSVRFLLSLSSFSHYIWIHVGIQPDEKVSRNHPAGDPPGGSDFVYWLNCAIMTDMIPVSRHFKCYTREWLLSSVVRGCY